MIDLEKRRRIMQRSIKLGHCICNPKQGCPCETFKARDICPCAGEKPAQAVEQVELTKLVEKAGCASKISQDTLKEVLGGLPQVSHPNVLVGSDTCDDAGVYRLDAETALVQTVDVFTPNVDDPYTFGQIAAANSLSDVYAMGGRALTALSIIAFPTDTLSPRIMTQMLRGGLDKMREAGVPVIGGHSISDAEPKFGYSVTGLVDPARIITNAGAKPGDMLVLTKPLGVGVISFAAQCGSASESAVAAAASVMTELNKTAAEVMADVGVNAATDVTGFGLLGHLSEMAAQSGVTVELYAAEIPVLDEVLDYIRGDMISGSCERNREHSSGFVECAEDVSEELQWALYDPQTSGGLLISVPQDRCETLVTQLRARGVSHATVIGRAVSKSSGQISITQTSPDPSFARTGKQTPENQPMPDTTAESCCCGAPGASAGATAEERFMDFMGAVNADGAINVRTKELIAIALSVVSKCGPCVTIHMNKARKLGVGDDEINEAVWMGIAFGGAPTMMFYNTLMEKD